MQEPEAKRIVEALLFVSGHPLTLKRLLEIVPELDGPAVRACVQSLNEEYAVGRRAFRIQEVAGGYQLATEQDLAPWIKRLLEHPRPDAVSAAAMETLAIVAYRQPLTKAEIEAIRGVDVSASLDTLLEKQFVRITGRKESPGRPYLYGTTNEFLRHFGLRSLEALPSMQFPEVQEQTSAAPASAVAEAPTAAAPAEESAGAAGQETRAAADERSEGVAAG